MGDSGICGPIPPPRMDDPSPNIAIVTPSLNQRASIGATIESVLSQNYPRLDYLVMDGGSNDGTVELLQSFGSRIRFVAQPDAGQADAINRGFGQCRGAILGWLNSDDTLAAGALATVAKLFAAYPNAAVIYGDCDFIDAAGKRIGRCEHIEPFNLHRLRHYSDFIVQPAAFFRRSAFESVGGLDASLHRAMDYDLWLKLAETVQFHYEPVTLANYRWVGTNKSGEGGWKRLAEVRTVAERHGLPMSAYFQMEAVALHGSEMWAALCRGQLPAALRSLAGAVRLATSPRVLASLARPQTWRVILMGQKLRRAAHAT